MIAQRLAATPRDTGSAAGASGLLRRLRPAVLLAALAAAGSVDADVRGAGAAEDPRSAGAEAGRRIYLEGLLPSGEPLRAMAHDGAALTGQQAACVSCHRRSGLGVAARGTMAPPVTGDILYRPVWRGRPEMDMARMTGANARPAYSDATLERAIVDGLGADGSALGSGMPRYRIAAGDASALLAYLKTLSSKPSPGADASVIRFATVVAGDVPQDRRKALIDVIQTFAREKNAGTRHENRRRTRPPMDMEFHYILYRDWIVDVWTVTGPPGTWRAQLDRLYQAQPVFAVLGGVAEGPWAPIHEFCEAEGVPCVFPSTDLPVVDAAGSYVVYFSRGMTLEGEVLAAYVNTRPEDAPGQLVQVYREGRPGATAAAALAARATARANPAAGVALKPGEAASPAFWSRLAAAHPGATLAVWLESADLEDVATLASAQPAPARLFLSSGLAAGAALPDALRSRTRYVHPFERPDEFDLRVQRTRTWLRSRKLANPREERTQAEAFFAVSIVSEALMHNFNFFVREYLLEQFERMARSMVVTAYYPEVALGAGQRFGSRGAYIVKPGALPGQPATAVSEWIVP